MYEFTDQCAYRVTSPVTAVPKSYFDPPLLAVYQPWNVWPARVGLAGCVALDPYLTDCEATAEPPFESNDTVYVLTVQCAYTVVFAASMVVDELTWLPPLLAVYQPWNA